MRDAASHVGGEGARSPSPPERPMGVLGAGALVVASMVGTGAFVTSGYLIRELGAAWLVLTVWAAGGLLALCGATVYAELGAMMPRAGGEYVYLSRAFHPALGFLSGWTSLLVGFAAPIAASARVFAATFKAEWPAVPVEATAVGLIALLTFVHTRDVAWGTRVQTAFTLLQVAVLCSLSLALLFGHGSWTALTGGQATDSFAKVAISLVLVSFSYSGWNAAAYVAGELENPQKTLPRALVVGTASVAVLYLVLNVTFLYAAPPEVLGARPQAIASVAARASFGSFGAKVISACVALVLVSSCSAMLMAGPRVSLAMAKDGLFFRVLARQRPSGAPWASVVTHGLLAALFVLTPSLESLLAYIGFSLSGFSALTVLGAMVLRRREPNATRPYRAFGWPLTPVAFVSISLWTVLYSVSEKTMAALASVATLTLGLGFYLFWSRRVA